ncbi:MAG TPA: ABC transporter permease [Pirellulales bacterium]|jgi:putative ABC transport system permease protein
MHLFTLVWRNVTRRWLRSALTVIAVAVAIGSMVALVGIADSFVASFLDVYLGAGIDMIVVRTGVQERINSGLDIEIGDKIRSVPDIVDVIPTLLDVVSFEEQNLYGVPLRGLQPSSRLVGNLNVVEGRALQGDDRQALLIGRTLAENLGKKLGDSIELYALEKFNIVGIYESHNVFDNSSMVIALADLQRLMDRPGQVTGFAVSVAEPNNVALIERVAKDIEAVSPGLTAMSIKDHVAGISQIRAVQGMAWLTALIGLIVGTIGVLNTMFMTVLERTREIGILRAIGWRQGRIVRMILSESLLVSLIGAAIGTLGAVGLTKLLSTLPVASGVVDGTVPWRVMVEGWILALMVGLVGAAYPAYRSARLLPTAALRHD